MLIDRLTVDKPLRRWCGWKHRGEHLDVADGDIPISAILTSASLHDSQAAIPLATMRASRVINLYDVMDSAYDAVLRCSVRN
jgi:hypothetical protein